MKTCYREFFLSFANDLLDLLERTLRVALQLRALVANLVQVVIVRLELDILIAELLQTLRLVHVRLQLHQAILNVRVLRLDRVHLARLITVAAHERTHALIGRVEFAQQLVESIHRRGEITLHDLID